jgi:hypothetical protein
MPAELIQRPQNWPKEKAKERPEPCACLPPSKKLQRILQMDS